MVLEMLFKLKEIKENPLKMLIMSIMIAIVSILIVLVTFPNDASILAIAFIAIGALPIIHKVFVQEEESELKYKNPSAIGFLGRHKDLIKVYSYFFLGIILVYAFLFVYLSPQLTKVVYSQQVSVLDDISELREKINEDAEEFKQDKDELNESFTKNALVVKLKDDGQFNYVNLFILITKNNLLVLMLVLIFSFIFGAGALFIIAWNGSIIGTVIGAKIVQFMGEYAPLGLIGGVAAHIHGLGLLMGFVPHGVPEVLAYFVAAIAGTILSLTISLGVLRTEHGKVLLKDVLLLIVIAVGLIVIGSVIESFLILAG